MRHPSKKHEHLTPGQEAARASDESILQIAPVANVLIAWAFAWTSTRRSASSRSSGRQTWVRAHLEFFQVSQAIVISIVITRWRLIVAVEIGVRLVL